MLKHGGVELFGGAVNANVLADILQWRNDPELRQIITALQAHTSRKTFLDTYAEAMAARHLLARGCALRFEIPTPTGRRADFEVRRGDQRFFLHVKRIDTARPLGRKLRISARLRSLERIKRPYIVQIRWIENVTRDQMQRLVAEAGEFILRAHVGDEMTSREDDGREIGGLRVIAPAPHDVEHVQLTIGLPLGFIDAAPRIRRLMHRAYQQFMPKSENVIVICSGHANDEDDFETALLGSHIERWDAFPPRGKRVAHGRAADGFWSDHRFAESRLAGWFCFGPKDDRATSKLWVRTGADDDGTMNNTLKAVLGSGSG